MVCKLANLSQQDVEAMLGITLKQTRIYQEAKEEGARSLILRQLNRRVGEVPESVRVQIDTLSITLLESLGEALLDFSALSDLETWLAEQRQ